jgi:hypothetical protein
MGLLSGSVVNRRRSVYERSFILLRFWPLLVNNRRNVILKLHSSTAFIPKYFRQSFHVTFVVRISRLIMLKMQHFDLDARRAPVINASFHREPLLFVLQSSPPYCDIVMVRHMILPWDFKWAFITSNPAFFCLLLPRTGSQYGSPDKSPNRHPEESIHKRLLTMINISLL